VRGVIPCVRTRGFGGRLEVVVGCWGGGIAGAGGVFSVDYLYLGGLWALAQGLLSVWALSRHQWKQRCRQNWHLTDDDDEEADKMAHARIKFVVGGLVILFAVAYLVVAGIRDGWVYSYKVDQIVNVASFQGKRLRLHGKVGVENFKEDRGALTAKFDLQGEKNQVRVEYSGMIPDLFKPDHEVVVEGYLDEGGIFRADTLLTKCASKYEAEDGQSPHGTREPKGSSEAADGVDAQNTVTTEADTDTKGG